MNKVTFIRINKIIAWALALGLFAYVAIANTLPFGAHANYTSSDNSVSALVPLNRVETTEVDGIQVTKQKDDLIYFTTKFPFKFDAAKVKITFKNPNLQQPIELGYKDRNEWHYSMQTADAPLFHAEGWHVVDGAPILYEKYPQFNSVEDFLANLPTRSTIGTLGYLLSTEEQSIPDYAPSDTDTTIDVPLRGSHTMYVYLENEPFEMTIRKQDINWHEDPYVMEIRVYKGDDLVYTVTIDDDGISDDSKRLGMEQEIVIKNPGPGLPESGVYKVVLDASSDTVIKSITTNLHKIVFAGPLYPVSNEIVYRGLVQKTSATILYTNSTKITATTYHNATLQNLIINGEEVPLTEARMAKVIPINAVNSTIVIPQSDVIISGVGYYAFSAEQFFVPNKFDILPITPTTDLSLADYILTPYKAPVAAGDGYVSVEREFDLASAVPGKGHLSWMIRAPGLKESEGEVIIKDISVMYSKEGWWKK